MKKFFTLIAAAMICFSANAQDIQNLGFTVTNPWHVSMASQSDVKLVATQEYAEFKLTNKTDFSNYKGIKVEFSNAKSVNDQNFQVKIVGTEKAGQYNWVNETYSMAVGTEGVIDVTFDEKYNNDPITAITLQVPQACVGLEIVVNKVTLIKKDGSEETAIFGGNEWGMEVTDLSGVQNTPAIIYTGVWGGVNITDANGTDISYDPASGETWEYNIKFAEALPFDVNVELHNDAAFDYLPTNAGATEVNFTLNAETKQVVKAVYMKANTENDALYPSTVQVTSATRVKKSATGINGVAENLNVDSKRYNLSGQLVNNNYKGVVIQNGKKFLNK